jgi:hypothetical protein
VGRLAAVATGVGPLPGSVADESARIVAGELPDFVHVVELPDRGPGSDLIGRTAGQICRVTGDFAVETTPLGWRITAGTGRVMRRAQSWFGEDCDALEITVDEYRGPVKVQLAGPWTLAAGIEMTNGERLVRDLGACRELGQALAQTCAAVVADIRQRVPGVTEIFVQLDEPALAAVANGEIGTASGLSRYAPVGALDLEQVLRTVCAAIDDAGAIPGVRAATPRTPWQVIRDAGAQFVGFDLVGAPPNDELLGSLWEAGVGIFAGCAPPTAEVPLTGTLVSVPIRAAAERLGLAGSYENIVVTPTTGLSEVHPDQVLRIYSACREAGRILREDAEPDGD